MSSYVATKDTAPETMADPQLSFAFCYIASHFRLGLVDGENGTRLMEYIEKHADELKALILNGG